MKIPLDLNPGDFLDRLSIAAVRHVQVKTLQAQRTLQQMDRIFSNVFTTDEQKQVMPLCDKLRGANFHLWDAENHLRSLYLFNTITDVDDFTGTVRQIYHLNDQRSLIKRQLDEMFGETPEKKSYAK